MAVIDLELLRARGVFAVERPIHVRIGGDANAGRGTEGQHLAVVFFALQRLKTLRQLAHFFRGAHEQYFEFAVTHIDARRIERQDTADTGGIAHRAEDEIVLDDLVVKLDFDVCRMDLGNVLDPVEQICRVPQGVLYTLGSGVARAGEGAEGGDIGKIAIAEAADVIWHGSAADDAAHGLKRLRRDVQARGKIVGRAGGDIADGNIAAALQQAVDGLVEGAVAAAADDQLRFVRVVRHGLHGVARAGGDVGGDLIPCLTESAEDLAEIAPCLTHTGVRIHHEQHFFHGRTDLS